MDRFENVLITALRRAFDVHEVLGEDGLEEVTKNEFGDVALRVDVEIEEVILQVLEESQIPVRVISEEHGTVEVGAHAKYLGILDGLDGTAVYKKSRGAGRYGTMFGIFNTTDPYYADYIACGVMEHSTNRMFIGIKDKGAYLIEGDVKTELHASRKKELDQETKIYIDEFGIQQKLFARKLERFKPKDREFSAISSAVHYADIAFGSADITIECTRKNNLEIAAAYGLITESGAVMVDIEGSDIGEKKYLEFGQKEELSVITASTKEIAEQVIKYIK